MTLKEKVNKLLIEFDTYREADLDGYVDAILSAIHEEIPHKRVMSNPVPDSDLVIGWNSCIDELKKRLK